MQDVDEAFGIESGGDKAISPASLTRLAWVVFGLELLITAIGGFLSYLTSTAEIGAAASGVGNFFCVFIIWSLTLHADCSTIPLKVSLLLAIPLATIGNITSTPHLKRYQGMYFFWLNFAINLIVVVAPWYSCLSTARRAMQKTYADNVTNTSMKIAAHWISSVPIVVYFSVSAVNFYIDFFEAMNTYEAHSPFCVYDPGVDRLYNNQFRCFSGTARNSYNDDISRGISEIPFYPTYNVNGSQRMRYSNLTKFAQEEYHDYGNAPLTISDYYRLSAVTSNEGGEGLAILSILQGQIFVICLFVGEVYLRVAKASLSDIASFEVTRVEFLALLCTSILVVGAFTLSALKANVDQAYNALYFILTLIVVLLFLLRKICLAELSGSDPILTTRNTRESAVSDNTIISMPSRISSDVELAPLPMQKLQKRMESYEQTLKEQDRMIKEQAKTIALMREFMEREKKGNEQQNEEDNI
ncbi:hypothetical protein TrVE_jg8332 [Triparma verrucosa]|uniref:Uncharacterized protein n=1 Tax=Triparma verrucosa TaxID=1606542 RepID=A0A9W7EZV6_9STRA|nr:hypothetical protein TrVE_jg8332 [Triparma verrucosa]